MATFEELQKSYAQKIHTAAITRGADAKKDAANEVVTDIRRYDSADQKRLAAGTLQQLGVLDQQYMRKDSENKNYLDLASYILSLYSGK